MNARTLAALAALLVVLPAFAGCTEETAPAGERVQPGSTSSPVPGSSATPGAATSPPPRIKSPSERWHFHDYWGRSPTIVLFDADVSLSPTTGADGLPALSALVELPQGVIVPPETGFLTVNVTWGGAQGGILNLTYRPADSNDFHPAGDLANGAPLEIRTTESMCDVPHRAQSFWRFNFTASPGGVPPSAPPKDFRVNITATIGRPLFIDPPHIDWWASGDTIPIVAGAAGEFQGAATPAANVSIPAPGSISPASAKPAAFLQNHRVPVDEGTIVPEQAKSVVVVLNWTSDAPNGKLTVRWKEGNSLTEGTMELLSEGEGSRVFAIAVTPGQTDTTYSNRTTWEFQILPEGEPPAFRGTYTLAAWASRLAPPEAAKAVLG